MLCLRAVVSKVEMIGQLRNKVSRSWYHRFFYTAIFMRPSPSKEMNTAECLHSVNYMLVVIHVDDILTKLTTIRALKIDINQWIILAIKGTTLFSVPSQVWSLNHMFL